MRISVTDKYSASSTYTNPIHKSLRKEIVWREVTELLLLLGIQPPLTTSLLYSVRAIAMPKGSSTHKYRKDFDYFLQAN